MAKARIQELLDGKWEDGTSPGDVFELHVLRNPSSYIDDIIAGLMSERKRVQSGCAELASLVSEHSPELLYRHLSLFEANLEANQPVLRWEAVCTIGNLARVDKSQEIRSLIDIIAGFLRSESIVLQVHSARALTKISEAFPDEAPGMMKRLLAAEDAFPGNRIGFIVESMGAFISDERTAKDARKFVERYARCETASVAAKALKVMRKIHPS